MPVPCHHDQHQRIIIIPATKKRHHLSFQQHVCLTNSSLSHDPLVSLSSHTVSSLEKQQQQQQQQHRSLSNQSRDSFYSSCSQSTAASITPPRKSGLHPFPNTTTNPSKRAHSKTPNRIHGNKNNLQISTTTMNNSWRAPYTVVASSSSNSERSEQQFHSGLRYNRSCSSSMNHNTNINTKSSQHHPHRSVHGHNRPTQPPPQSGVLDHRITSVDGSITGRQSANLSNQQAQQSQQSQQPQQSQQSQQSQSQQQHDLSSESAFRLVSYGTSSPFHRLPTHPSLIPSPCSTCSSSTTPDHSCRSAHPTPLAGSSSSVTERPCDAVKMPSQQRSTVMTTEEDPFCLPVDVSSPSAFSPSTLRTPAHPHHCYHQRHQQRLLMSSGAAGFPTSASAALRPSTPPFFTDSQPRTLRQDEYQSDSCPTQSRSRHMSRAETVTPYHSASSSHPPIVDETFAGINRAEESSNSSGCHHSEKHPASQAGAGPQRGIAGTAASSLGSISIITPVKTGKKVQYRKTKVCPWNQHGRCVMGESCNYAHAKTELRFRPDLTRTRLCPDVANCKKSNCRFAHDLSQLRATGAFYRTKLCKFWIRGGCPSGDRCRHAHGSDQLRHPEAIVGGPGDHESPKEAILLSRLVCNQHMENNACNEVSCRSVSRRGNDRMSKNSHHYSPQSGRGETLDTQEKETLSHGYSENENAAAQTTVGSQQEDATSLTQLMSSENVPQQQKTKSHEEEHPKCGPTTTTSDDKTQRRQPMFGLANQQQTPVQESSCSSSAHQLAQPHLYDSLSDDVLCAALVSDYYYSFLTDSQKSLGHTSSFNTTSTASTGSDLNHSLLGSCHAMDTTQGTTEDGNEDDAMTRLVEALTASSVCVGEPSSDAVVARSSSPHETPYYSEPHEQRPTSPPTPIPLPSMMARSASENMTNEFIQTAPSSYKQHSSILTPDDRAAALSFRHLGEQSVTAFASSPVEQQQQQQQQTSVRALNFPTNDDLPQCAADLKLNDILKIAVASQDPDLLECSAKILRASIQYKKQENYRAHQQQQQTHQAQATTALSVSSFPSTLGLATTRYSSQHHNFFNAYRSDAQSFYL